MTSKKGTKGPTGAGKRNSAGMGTAGRVAARNNAADQQQVKENLAKATEERQAAIGDPDGWDAAGKAREDGKAG